MRQRIIVTVGVIACGTIGLGAYNFNRVIAPACREISAFARTAQPSFEYYQANTCETVYADGMFIILPALTGLSEPQRITVTNVGMRTVFVVSHQPADSIDPTLERERYGTAPQYIPGVSTIALRPKESITVTAMPSHLPNAWYTQARTLNPAFQPPTSPTSPTSAEQREKTPRR